MPNDGTGISSGAGGCNGGEDDRRTGFTDGESNAAAELRSSTEVGAAEEAGSHVASNQSLSGPRQRLAENQ